MVAIYMKDSSQGQVETNMHFFSCLFRFGCTAGSGESGVVLLPSRDLGFLCRGKLGRVLVISERVGDS